jgi:hypothetical protein
MPMTTKPDPDIPVVDGIAYKPHGCATEAFRYTLDLPVFADRPNDETGQWVRERLDKFVAAMPDWLAEQTVEACEVLATKVREVHNLPGEGEAP